MPMKLPRRLFAAICLVLLAMPALADDQISQLEQEMYRYFYTEDSLNFHKTTALLKEACLKAGDETSFYRAWGNMAIYEATHQRRTHALGIAREMEDYAEAHKSTFGTYTAIHVMGNVYHQMRDYANAEKTFKDAINYLHRNMPGESAAADYIELILISVNGYNNRDQGLAYAVEALEEPNLSAPHRLRVLTMLCQLEGEKPDPDRDVFNRYYEERLQVKQGTPADKYDKLVEELHYFVNGDYEQALKLADSLSTIDQCIYEKARIYHKLGKDHEAYLLMVNYKLTRDSLFRAEHKGLLSEYITQLNMERLTLKNKQLSDRYDKLIFAMVILVIGLFILLLVWVIRKRGRLTRMLQQDNAELGRAHREAEEARDLEHEERRKVEKQLDVKREFLNNIAKELRSPLNPITGFSDILAAGEIELSPEERVAMSQHIKESSQALTSIIDNMIELSYYESKAKIDRDDEFSPVLVCQNAIDYATRFRQRPDVELSLYTTLPEEQTMKSDMQAVGKVLRHLLDNAMKYTEKGGVLLHCSKTSEGMIRFMVTDTGCGIDDERRPYIFNPSIHERTSVSATSMGLAICYNIVSLLGGRIWLDEGYKNGCRFIFDLPEK